MRRGRLGRRAGRAIRRIQENGAEGEEFGVVKRVYAHGELALMSLVEVETAHVTTGESLACAVVKEARGGGQQVSEGGARGRNR